MKNNWKFTIGIDLGGTKLASALVNSSGKIIAYQKDSIFDLKNISPPSQSQKMIVELMLKHIAKFKLEYPIAFKSKIAIGLGSAGPLDVNKGTLVYPSNFAQWKIVPIVKILRSSLKKSKLNYPIYFQNDAICSALAEGWIGKAKKLNTYALVTVGTGIGTGVIFNSKPLQSNGKGSEFGHIVIREGADFYSNTVEGISSGTAILKIAKEKARFLGNSVEELVLAHQENPSEYQFIFDNMGKSLGVLCYNLTIGLNLEKILISGGLVKIKDLYIKQLKDTYENLLQVSKMHSKCKIEIAKTKNMAGVIGAARLPYLFF